MAQKEENSSLIYIISLIIFGVQIVAANSLSSRTNQTKLSILTVVSVTTAPPTVHPWNHPALLPPQRRCASVAATVWAWRWLSRTSPSVGTLMDVASPSEAERRIPQMAE